jgi:hypothetical protein
MGTTTNNGWTYPESTDLVKDGATAIETLATNIDTTLGVYADPGLVLINTTSFSAVASQSVNDVFSSTYTNYKIVVELLKSTTTGFLQLRFRASGADDTSANYYSHVGYPDAAGAGYLGQTGAGLTSMRLTISATTTDEQFADLTIYNPNKASVTTLSGTQLLWATTPQSNGGHFQGTHNVATAYTGLTLLQSAGNMTGSVSVYGYNK